MKINSITNNKNYINPAFGTTNRAVQNKAGNLIYRNTTTFFRSDLDWDKLCYYIRDKYKNADKVNLFCQACSDGSEPMSIAILLKEKFGCGARKFFPIIAKDVDSLMIKRAKSEFVEMDHFDIRVINKFTDNKIKYYFGLPRNVIGFRLVPATINPWFHKKIKYSVADIKEDYKNIKPDNTILFCRNFWPYLLDDAARIDLINNIKSKFNKNCAIVIGSFDNQDISMHNMLLDAGFKEAEYLTNVYEIG